MLAVCSTLAGLKPPREALAAIVAGDGRVLAQVEPAALPSPGIDLPAGVGVLLGTGAGAHFLRASACPGNRLVFQTTAACVPIEERPEQQIPLMTNPRSAQVRRHILSRVEEIVRGYPIDGTMFDDRLRYAGIHAGVSEETRRQCDQDRGLGPTGPDDVFRWEMGFPQIARQVVPGSHYDAWLLWRALTIRNFVAQAARTVRSIRPTATVSADAGSCYGVYSEPAGDSPSLPADAGSWYGEYPACGANWAADDSRAGFRFLTDSCRRTGFAGLLDWLATGRASPAIARALAAGAIPGASVEAAGQLSNPAASDQTWTCAGITLTDYSGRPEVLRHALQAAAATTQGIIVFDLPHCELPATASEQFWAVFGEAFREPAVPPHAVPGLPVQVRREKAERKARGVADPPVIIHGGIPGTGL